MAEIPDSGREQADLRLAGAAMTAAELEVWFVREILPLETMLMRFLRRKWRDRSDIEDLRQEIYVRVCEAAEAETPKSAKSFVFATARNLLTDLIRKENVVPIDAVADPDAMGAGGDIPLQDRTLIAKDELRRLQTRSTSCRRAIAKPLSWVASKG